MHQSRYKQQDSNPNVAVIRSYVLRLKALFGAFMHFNSRRGMMSQCCQGLLGPGRVATINGFAAGTKRP